MSKTKTSGDTTAVPRLVSLPMCNSHIQHAAKQEHAEVSITDDVKAELRKGVNDAPDAADNDGPGASTALKAFLDGVAASVRQGHDATARPKYVDAVLDTAAAQICKLEASPPPEAGTDSEETQAVADPQHTAATTAPADADTAAQLGRGRRARKLTTKLAAAGAEGIAALGRVVPPHAAAARARAPKRLRDDSPDGTKASPDTAAGSTMTVALVRPLTPPAAAGAPATARAKRARKGTPTRASD